MRRVRAFTSAVAILLSAGCLPKIEVSALKGMQPARPVELEQLAPFIGKWKGAGEIKMAVLDELLPTQGVSENSWDCDGWCMVERDEYEMGELGKISDISVWTWDARSRKFRISRYDSMGGAAYGTAVYDEDSKCWTLKSKTKTPWGKMRSRGTVKMTDPNTIEWTWDEWSAWDVFGFLKIADMKGTNRRT